MPYNFVCFDTEDNSKELLLMGRSGFDKSVTQIAIITADGDKQYVGTPPWDRDVAAYRDILQDRKTIAAYKAASKEQWNIFKQWTDDLFDWQSKHSPDVIKQGIEFLRTSKQRYIYAHNLQYDLGNLFSAKLDDLDVTMVGGRLIKGVWGKKVYVDSYNIWPMKAAKIGEAFGIKKLDTASMSSDKEYVFRDTQIIQEAMTFAWRIAEGLGIKHLPPTLGGLCIKVWKHLGGENTHDSHELSREALFGGRVELFAITDDTTWNLNKPNNIYQCFHGKADPTNLTFGKGDVAYTDLNSLYPAMMRKEYPGEMEPWTKLDLPKFGIVKCMVEQPETDLPVLPYRGKDGRILYPWGKFKGTWTVAELSTFLLLGGKMLKIYDCIGTDEGCNPYNTFVDVLYKARLECTTEAEKLFYKLLMNNLFGRLGTSGTIGRSVWQTDKNKFEGIPYGEKVLVNYQMPLSDETNWSHAAYVTAYGRLELHSYLRLIGTKYLIYCDTDSCVFNCPKRKLPFTVGKELGQMKLEGFEDVAFAFAPKMYKLGNHYKAKGVPVAQAQRFIETGKAEFDLPFKLREAMRFYDRENSKRLSVWRNVQKFKQTNYDRKKLLGNQFYPCKVNGV